jgi:hypothetical protein
VADQCASCGAKLGFFRRLRGTDVCAACTQQTRDLERRAAQRKYQVEYEAREQYQRLIRALGDSGSDAEELAKELPSIAASTGLPPAELRKLNLDAYRTFLMGLLADDHLSVDEEQRMNRVAGALAIDQSTFESAFDVTEHPKAATGGHVKGGH